MLLPFHRIVIRNSLRKHYAVNFSKTVLQQRWLASDTSTMTSRLGMGSAKWNIPGYNDCVSTALLNGITLIESGQDGGDAALAHAYREAVEKNPDILKNQRPTKILFRVGYRVETRSINSQQETNEENGEEKSEGGGQINGESVGYPGDVLQTPKVEDNDNDNNEGRPVILHNLSPEFVQYAVTASPLYQLVDDYKDHLQLVVMVHNPEVQTIGNNDLKDERDRQLFLKKKLQTSFDCISEMNIPFGVTSNGFCLPHDHPLYLSHETVLRAATTGESQKQKLFQMVQLPANALETTGMDVAKTIQTKKHNYNLDHLQVLAMRPLTCYPDAGTGSGHPFLLADWSLPTSSSETLWTNEMNAPPAAYEMALKSAMSHFTAEEILDKQAADQTLTSEERETLDGCKLLQSVLHDLDLELPKMRSFTAHENALYTQVIPIIQDTFESYDEDTARILQNYFAAYGWAVRYYVAKNTRHLLLHGEIAEGQKHGEVDGTFPDTAPTYNEETDLPPTKRLQEFGLDFILNAKMDDGKPLFDTAVVGFSDSDQVTDSIEIASKHHIDNRTSGKEEK